MVGIFTGRTLGLETGSGAVLGDRGVRGTLGDASLGRAGEGVYVNAATGDLVVQRQDEFLVGKGLDAGFVQTYNSFAQSTGVPTDDNGDRWRQGFDRRVYGATTAAGVTPVTGTSKVYRVGGDGAEVAYTWNGSAYVATDGAGAYDTLVRQVASSTWLWTDGDTHATEAYYDETGTGGPAGRLKSQSDVDGNTILFSYDNVSGKLTTIETEGTVTDPSGNTMRLGRMVLNWDAATDKTNNIASIVTEYADLQLYSGSTAQAVYRKVQTSTSYVYESYKFNTTETRQRLISIQVDLTPDVSTDGSTEGTAYSINYSYDASNRLVGITQTDGSSLVVGYDALGRVSTLTQAVSAGTTRVTGISYATRTGGGVVTTITDPSQQGTSLATVLEADGSGNLVKITAAPASATSTAQSVSFAYTSNGDVTQVTDALGNVISYSYDDLGASQRTGNWFTRTSPGVGTGTTTVTRTYGSIRKSDGAVFAYSTSNPPSLYADSAQYVTNVVLSETTNAADDTTAYGAVASHTTRYVYDREGHLRYAIGALGEVTEYRYTSAGQRSYEIGYPEQRYDLTGLAAAASPSEAQVNTWRDGLTDRSSAEIASYSYDLRGNLITSVKYGLATTAGVETTSNGYSKTTYIYDQAGRLMSQTDGTTQATTTYLYDGLDRTIATTGADGGTTSIAFQDKSSTTVVTLASGLVQTSTYNLAGELIATTDNQSAPANAAADLTTWSLNNLTRTSTTAIGGKAAYLYTVNASGASASTTTGLQAVKAGETMTFEVTLKETAGGNAIDRVGINASDNGWGLDGLSWAVVVKGPGSLSRYSGGLFTVNGLSTTEETVIRVMRVFTADTTASAIAYIGPLSSSATAGDSAIMSAPVLTHETMPVNLVDKLGRTRVAIDGTGNFRYIMYDAAGRKTGDIGADGSLIAYRYDANNRLVSTTRYATKVTNPGGLLDPNNTLFIGAGASAVAGNICPAAATGDEWTWHVYDNAGRVIETIGGDGAVTRFDFDEGGNLTRTWQYADRLGSSVLNGFKTTPPVAAVWPSSTNTDGIYSGGYDLTQSWYDKQGRLLGSMDRYGGLAEIVYDAAGRKIDEVRYEKQVATSFANAQGATVSRSSTSFVDVKFNAQSQAGIERHTRHVYDGRLLRYVVDALNYVTQYDYDTAAGGTAMIRYATKLASTTTDFTFDAIQAALATHSTDRKTWSVFNVKGQVAYTIDGEGAVTGFAYDATGNVIRSTQYSTLRSTTSLPSATTLDTWVASTPTGAPTTIGAAPDNRTTRNFYDMRGQLAYVVDGEGYVTKTEYDEAGRVTAVTRYDSRISGLDGSSTVSTVDSKVATLSYSRTWQEYDALGRLSNSYDALNVRTHYDYYATGEVWKKTVNADGGSAAVVTRYTYEAAGRVAMRIEADGQPEQVTTSYTYDAFGNVASVTDALNNTTYNYYDLMGRLLWTRDAESYVTGMTYTSFGEVASVTRYANKTASAVTSVPVVSTSAADATTYSYYDKQGRVLWTRDAENYVTGTTYTNFGEVKSVTRYANKTASAVTDVPAVTSSASDATGYSYYDKVGRVLWTRDAEDYVTGMTYTSFGEVASITRYASKTTSAVTSVPVVSTSAADATTYSYYDKLGRVLWARDAEDYVTGMTYTSFGGVASVTRYASKTTSAVTSVPVVSTSAADATTYSYYDKLGRVLWTRDAENYVTGTTYTSFGGVASITRYAGKTTSAVASVPGVSTSSDDATTSFAYDRLGRLLTTTDATGKTESQTYTATGEVASRTNKLGGVTTYTYDMRGLLKTETMSMSSVSSDGSTQASSVQNTYDYDARGNRIVMIEAKGRIEQRTTTYGYDLNNRLTSVRGDTVAVLSGDATSASVEATAATQTATRYDARGNVLEVAIQSVVGNTVTTLSRTLSWYDRLGRKTSELKAGSAIDKGTLTRWDYDTSGNVQQQTVYGNEVTIPALLPADTASLVPSGGLRTTTFSYDKLNRLKTTTVASVRVGSYSGSAYGFSTVGLVTTNFYDSAGNLIQQTDVRNDNTYFYYDRLGRKTAQVDRENYLTAWTLDDDGNVTDEVRYANKVTGTVGTASVPGAVAPGTTQLPATYVIKDGVNDRSTHFTYDKMGRRKTEERAGVRKAVVDANGKVTKDASGNPVTTIVTSTISYGYNDAGQVTSKQEATGDKTVYAYDGMGRMISETDLPAGSYNDTTMTVDLTNAPVTTFFYDGLGNLTRSVENGRVTQYQYNAAGKLTRLINSDSVSHYYYYDAMGNRVADKYRRTGADSTAAGIAYDAVTYAYDAAGRQVTQGYASVTGTTWSTTQLDPSSNTVQQVGDKTMLAYNAYGEVAGRGINLTSAQLAAGAYQDQFEYDNAGRLQRTTAGDGTVHLYLYDENGNQTLDITSSGASLANNRVWANPGSGQTQLDLTTALTLLSTGGTVGNVVVQGMVVTQYVYDGRNQLTQTRSPKRETTALGSYSANALTIGKAYNAFGEVTSETDARNNVTNYTYNTLGKVTKRELPAVSWTAENGALATARPTENYFYDVSGRSLGVQDANGNVNSRSLLAGTGYGKDSEALVLKEFHADGGIFAREYDLHHDMVTTTNEVGKVETYTYDALGQLTQQVHQARDDGTQLADNYDYDNLGHRTLHWNSQLGSTIKETTEYDIQGRVTSQIDLGGDTTSYKYTWNSSFVTSGLGTFGGWTKVTTNAAGKTKTEQTDYYGRAIDMVDYGGHDYNYTFDLSGRLVRDQILSTGRDVAYTYYNTGMMASVTSMSMATAALYAAPTIRVVSTYQYDIDNHRTYEGYKKESETGGTWTGGTWANGVWTGGAWSNATWTASATFQNATVTWDAAGRMTAFDSGTVYDGASVNIDYEYDLTGNVRRTVTDYSGLDADGNVITTASRQEYWYKYDSMNRFVTTKGQLVAHDSSGAWVSGSAARGLSDAAVNRFTTGVDIQYNEAGQRISAARTKFTPLSYGIVMGASVTFPATSQELKELYSYSEDGYLQTVSLAAGAMVSSTTATAYIVPTAAGKTGNLQANYARDAMGRVTDLMEYQADGTTMAYHRAVTYNARSQVTLEDTYTRSDAGELNHDHSTYYYYAVQTAPNSGLWGGASSATAGAVYMGGVVTRVYTQADQIKADNVTYNDLDDTRSTYTFGWWDQAEQVRMDHDVDFGNSSNNIWYSTRALDESGRLVAASVRGSGAGPDARARDLTFINDANGQILQRDEVDYTSTTTGNPRELHYYFNGQRIGDISNNGTSDVDYATSVAMRNDSGYGAFRGGANSSTAYADFDQSYDPINGLTYESTSSRYTVQDGDTLSTIALKVWGDASYWYLIADANGLDGSETLAAGQSLILPSKVHNAHNNTSTYRVYDPNEAIGDTAPTAAKPPKQGCGAFGAILLAVIAVAVVAVLHAPVGNFFSGLFSSTISGSAVTLGGAVIPAATGTFMTAGGALAAAVATGATLGAAASIVSQGVGVALGIQDSFSWKAVGMAALGGAVGGGLQGSGLFGEGIGKSFTPGSLGIKNAIVDAAIRGATANVLTQGIGVATGLQDHFDWTGVAAAGIGAGVGNLAAGTKFSQNLGKFGARLFSDMAGGMANAATRSLINGTDFGDNIIAALPDMIANTIGNLAAEKLASIGRGGGVGVQSSAADEALNVIDQSGQPINLPAWGDVVTPSILSAEQNISMAEAVGQISHSEAEDLRGLKYALMENQRDSALASTGAMSSQVATADGLPRQPTGGSDLAISLGVLNSWREGAASIFASGKYSSSYYSDIKAGYDRNEVFIGQWNNVADHQVNEILRAGLAPADFAFGAYNISGGSGEFRDYAAVGGVVLGGGGKLLGAVAESGALQKIGRAFYDPRPFRAISREYWSLNGPANGASLHHWLIPQRATFVPVGIRNAGFNLLKLPSFEGVFHRSLGLNQWMGFARNWGPAAARNAATVENAIRIGVPAAAVGSGYAGYELGRAVSGDR